MIFQPIELVWNGETYTIPANRVMGAIAAVEEVITFAELHAFGARRAAPVARLAMAYGALLRYAGAKVSDDEVYEHVFKANGADTVVQAVSNIMRIMIPPSVQRDLEAEAAKPGDTPLGNPPAAVH